MVRFDRDAFSSAWPFLNSPRGAWIFVLAVFPVVIIGTQHRSSRARCTVACAGAAAPARFFYYVVTDTNEASWQRDRSVPIYLDTTYRKGDVFMIVRCVQASISSDCRFLEFTLEGFGQVLDLSSLAPSSESEHAMRLRFSDVWTYHQSPAMLWRSAEAAGLPLTGPFQISNDLDPKRQACSRLLQELFGRTPSENSGRVVTEKFAPWVASLFQAAKMATHALASSANTGDESELGKSGAWPCLEHELGDTDDASGSNKSKSDTHSAEASESAQIGCSMQSAATVHARTCLKILRALAQNPGVSEAQSPLHVIHELRSVQRKVTLQGALSSVRESAGSRNQAWSTSGQGRKTHTFEVGDTVQGKYYGEDGRGAKWYAGIVVYVSSSRVQVEFDGDRYLGSFQLPEHAANLRRHRRCESIFDGIRCTLTHRKGSNLCDRHRNTELGKQHHLPKIGTHVKVYWAGEDQWYRLHALVSSVFTLSLHNPPILYSTPPSSR